MKKPETKRNYLTGKEIRAIARENAKTMKRLEAYKNRDAEEEEFLSEMRGRVRLRQVRHQYVGDAADPGSYRPDRGRRYPL